MPLTAPPSGNNQRPKVNHCFQTALTFERGERKLLNRRAARDIRSESSPGNRRPIIYRFNVIRTIDAAIMWRVRFATTRTHRHALRTPWKEAEDWRRPATLRTTPSRRFAHSFSAPARFAFLCTTGRRPACFLIIFPVTVIAGQRRRPEHAHFDPAPASASPHCAVAQPTLQLTTWATVKTTRNHCPQPVPAIRSLLLLTVRNEQSFH